MFKYNVLALAICAVVASVVSGCSDQRMWYVPAEVHEASVYIAKQGNDIEAGYGDYVQLYKGTKLVGVEYRLTDGRYIVATDYAYSSEGDNVSATVATQGKVGYLSQIRLDSLGLPVSSIISDVAKGVACSVDISYYWHSNGDLSGLRLHFSQLGKDVEFSYDYQSDVDVDARLYLASLCPEVLNQFLPGGVAYLVCEACGTRFHRMPSRCSIMVYSNNKREGQEVDYKVSDGGKQLSQVVYKLDFLDDYSNLWISKNAIGHINYVAD